MADIISRLTGLSPEKQRLLALKLKLKGGTAAAPAGQGGGERPSIGAVANASPAR